MPDAYISSIVVAAGKSRRMGFDKLSAEIAGVSVLARAISAFENCSLVREIVVVTSPDRISAVRDFGFSKIPRIVEGGASRHLSVWNGIEAANTKECELLAVHDGARPLITEEAILKCAEAAMETGAARPGSSGDRHFETCYPGESNGRRVSRPG